MLWQLSFDLHFTFLHFHRHTNILYWGRAAHFDSQIVLSLPKTSHYWRAEAEKNTGRIIYPTRSSLLSIKLTAVY